MKNREVRSEVRIRNEEFKHKITMPYEGRTFIIEYGKYGSDLVLYEEGDNTAYMENKILIHRLGVGFNELLSKGPYQEFFTEEMISN